MSKAHPPACKFWSSMRAQPIHHPGITVMPACPQTQSRVFLRRWLAGTFLQEQKEMLLEHSREVQQRSARVEQIVCDTEPRTK